MKIRRIVPWVMCALLLAGGCAKGPDIVGTWTGLGTLPSDDGKAGTTVPTRLDLRQNGTFHYKGASETEYDGTYTVKDNVLTETMTGYTSEGKVMPIPADAPNVETDTFTLNGDTLTLTPKAGGPPSVLKRLGAK